MFALFTILAMQLPPDPGAPLRLYEKHATIALDEWEADPSLISPGGPFDGVALAILTPDIGVPTAATANMQKQCWRARDMGVPCIPGMRVYPATPEEAVSQAWWDGVAVILRQVVAVAKVEGVADHDPVNGIVTRPGGDGRVMIDCEDYGPTVIIDDAELASQGITKATLQQRMAVATGLVVGLNVVMYPVNETDHAHAEFFEVSGAPFEIWSERTFDAGEHLLSGNGDGYALLWLASMRQDALYRAKWPGAQIRYGLNDDYWRIWGNEIRAAVGDFGPLKPWTWRRWRADTNNPSNAVAIGGADWVSGTWFDSRNDAAHVFLADVGTDIGGDLCGSWWCAPVVNAGENYHGTIAGTCEVGGHVVGVGPSGGLVFDNGEYWWPYCNDVGNDTVTADATSVAVTLTVPASVAVGGVVSHYNQTGLRIDGDDLVLRYVDASGAHDQVITQVPRDVPVTFTLSWDAPSGVVRVAASVDPNVETQPYEVSAPGLLTDANPAHLYAARAFDGSSWVYCEGCELSGQVSVHSRTLSCAEMNEGGPGSLWPYGRF